MKLMGESMKRWTRGEKIAFWTFVLTIVTIIVSIATPEIRTMLGYFVDDTKSRITKVSSLPVKSTINKQNTNSILYAGISIKIFNACRSINAHTKLKSHLLEAYSNKIQIDAEYNWAYRYEMETTEIFYISHVNESIANSIEKYLNGEQIIVDYETEGKSRGFFGFDQRDIAIFIGNDYEKIFSTFN